MHVSSLLLWMASLSSQVDISSSLGYTIRHKYDMMHRVGMSYFSQGTPIHHYLTSFSLGPFQSSSLINHHSSIHNNGFTRYKKNLSKKYQFKRMHHQNLFVPGMPSENESPWYMKDEIKDSNLPFHCTGCGKCCKTRGDVIVSPNEVKKAANYLNITVTQFKDLYGEYEQHDSSSQSKDLCSSSWIILKNNNEGACIFLDENNMCSIYEARPLQCSTYPFLPRIMESSKSWNNEVRLRDDEVDNYDDDDDDDIINQEFKNQPKYWSVEDGGCEGMNFIPNLPSNNIDGAIIRTDEGDEGDGVSVLEAHEMLEFFKRYKRQVPHGKFDRIDSTQ